MGTTTYNMTPKRDLVILHYRFAENVREFVCMCIRANSPHSMKLFIMENYYYKIHEDFRSILYRTVYAASIGHFRVQVCLLFKASESAKFL